MTRSSTGRTIEIRRRDDGEMQVIKVLLKNGENIEFALGDDKKELDLVMRFHHGLDGNTVLNLKTNRRGAQSRIKVSEIKNMQHLKRDAEKAPESDLDSKFKTREEYENWKRQKMKDRSAK